METYIVNAPVKIYCTQLGVPQDYRQKLINETHLLKNRKGRKNHKLFQKIFNEDEKQVIASNFSIWEESTIYNNLLDNILITLEQLDPVFHCEIVDAWVGIYDRGQMSNPHSHEPNFHSFVYYIVGEEPYTPMIFKGTGLEIDAITDRLILFPSNISHSVPPSKGGERIIIAGNIKAIKKQ